jgi:hypothetical protein
MTDAEFLAAFESCTLTAAEWTHAAHVRMAWLYLASEIDFEAALAKVRLGIQRFNERVLAKPEGYHETITHALLRLIDVGRPDEPRDETFDSFCRRNSDLMSSGALAMHFSKALLDTPPARQTFVPPDRLPLP